MEFAYNNAKNSSTSHISFKFNCGYHLCVSYEKDLDPRSKSKIAEELSSELQNFIAIYQQNLHHVQEFQKQAHDKRVKLQSYTPGDKVWLSSKHLITKQNCKLKTKFLDPFWLLHSVDKQAYKLKLLKKWRFYNVFHVFLLEQDTTKKRWVNNIQLDFEFEASNNEEYEVNGIWDNAIYAKKSTTRQLLGLYYLVLWKSYPRKENTWEPALAI